jgi:transposase InsO family protein
MAMSPVVRALWIENPMDVEPRPFCVVAWIALNSGTVRYEPFAAEFQSHALEDWRIVVACSLISYGRPNPSKMRSSKRFNGRLRDECLNVHQFASLADAKAKIETWRLNYNQRRPHSLLDDLTPNEFVARCQDMRVAEAVAVSS